MAVGVISSPTTPIPIGTVASPGWASTVEDDVNAFLASVARAFLVPAYGCSLFTGAGAIGGWTDAAGGYVLSAAATNYVMMPVELPYGVTAAGAAPATDGNGTSPVLTGAVVRVKPGSTGVMTARFFGINRQNSTSSPLIVNVSALASSDGTSNDQSLTLTATSPPTIDATTAYFIQVISANTNDRVYSAKINYTAASF